jgi:hypothetical protein
MKHPSEDPLDPILRTWHVNPPADPDFQRRVQHRIHEHFFAHDADRVSVSAGSAIAMLLGWKPLALGAAAIALVLVSVTLTLRLHPGRAGGAEIPESYRVVIDPAQTARSLFATESRFELLAEKPLLSRDSFETALHWIEKQVQLEPSQMAGFQRVHERFFDQYERLCQQLFDLENQYRQFERDRISGQPIDLFRVHANFEQQKQIYQRTIQLQQELIHEVSALLTPQQQGAYGRLFPATPSTGRTVPSARLEPPTREWQI